MLLFGSARPAVVALTAILVLAAVPASAHAAWVRSYTEEDGLPSSWVADLAQGEDGRMWFLTDGGVAAFDGTRWEEYPLANGGALRGGFRFQLAAGGTGWAVTSDGALYRFDGEVWSVEAPSPIDRAPTVLSDFAVLAPDGDPVPVLATVSNGLFFYERGAFRPLPGEELPFESAYALLAVGGELLIGTDRGLWSWRPGRLTPRFTPPAGLSSEIRGISLEAPGDERDGEPRLLMIGADWIGRLEGADFSLAGRVPADPAWLRYHRTVVAADLRGGFYFGNPGGIYRLDSRAGRVETLDQERGLVGSGLVALHRDREQNLWLGTTVGVSRVPALPFQNLDARDGLFENEVTAIAEPREGTVILGHNEGLTYYRDGVDRTLRLPSRGGVARVLDLEPDERGGLWVAGAGLGLLYVDATGEVKHVAGGGPDPLSWINSARFDGDGALWVAGPRGVSRLQGDGLERVQFPFEDLHAVRRIFRGRSGHLYLATGGSGVLIRRGPEWARARHDVVAGNNVFAVLETSDQRVLVGSHEGLLELRGDALVSARGDDLPEISRPVYFLAEDRSGGVWIGTNFGVYCWQRDGGLHHFGLGRGLAGLETNRAAGFVDSAARVWVGTDRGVSLFDRGWERVTAAPPRVEILGAGARGRVFDAAQPVRLASSQNELTFRLRAISFVDERQLTFRTRLGGLASAWTLHETAPTRLELRFPWVPAGTYRLEAQARSINSEWGPITRSAPVMVSAPYWRRGWFLGLAGLSLILASLAGQSYFSQRRYARRLERDVERQTAELQRSRRAIEGEKERLAAILANIGDGVVALDGDGKVVLVNPAAERMLGLPADRRTDDTLAELLADRVDGLAVALRERLRELDEQLVKRSDPAPILVGGGRDAGVLELAVARYELAESERAGAILAFRDISERHRVEEEQARARRLEALGSLAGGIAHDFNNLLTTILGNLSLMREGGRVSAADDERLEDAEEAIDRAHRLARQLVTFAKGGAPVTAPVSLGDLVRRTARFVFSGSGVRYAIDLQDDLPAAEVDSDQVQQVFENLFLNARQAMGDRGMVRVTGERVEGTSPDASHDPGSYVRIDVVDRGEGIRPEDFDRIFEPYFTTKAGGTGLGLATSYSIVKRHGGHLMVGSTSAEGTVFSVFLPVARQSPRAKEAAGKPVTRDGRARVLVLEDQAPVASVLADMLASCGHQADFAGNGDEALELCREAVAAGRPFDVAILDLTIPGGLGGADIVRELRAIDGDLRPIASSGYSEGPVMSRFEAHGFWGVLPKPYSLAELERKIGEALQSRPSGGSRVGQSGAA